MELKSIFILLIISILISDSAFGQKKPVINDSIKIYENIQSYSKRSKFTEFIYQLIFKPVPESSKKNTGKKSYHRKKIQKPYREFEGKIIRKIEIVTLDPFGYSVKDTDIVAQNILFSVGNKLHITSRHITIRNLLIFHQNQRFDSLLVKESERLIRSQSYVQDVAFYITKTSRNSDSVDILIRELDNWSIIPKVDVSSSRVYVDVTDKNILGLGHEFQNAVTWNHTNGKNAYNTNYSIRNIRNTYISSMLHYGIDEYKNFNKSLTMERPFYSPFARWAAGIIISQQFRKDSINYINSEFRPVTFKFNIQDYWAGRAWQIFKGNTENERTTNLILAARFLNVHYILKPDEIYDTLHNYSDENLYMAAIGLSTRKYIQDKFIFNYGITEDVPIGKVYGLTGGYQFKNNEGRFYLGLRYSKGEYNELGYFSSNLEYGTFFRASKVEQGVFSAGINYFTNLIQIGNWKLRQFVKPQLTIGFNRFSYDSLTLKYENGLKGFNSIGLTGTNRFVITFQTQSYAPWNFLGFHFGPYFSYSLGILGDDRLGLRKSRVYSQIGLGVLIKNENLIINTFQFSISFYPVIPGSGHDIFKFNSFQTTDFGFRDFEIGKPTTINFR